MTSPFSIRFLGGASTVTGSKYLVQIENRKILVDCGLFQGIKALRLQNWDTLPVDPSTIDAVILTHAHLDHTGYLPLLVKHGFKGKIYCTEPTRDLTRIILLDSAKLQESDAEYANQKGFSKHKPALPLYTTKDSQAAIELLEPTPIDQWITPLEGVRFRFSPSGHILGSAFIELEALTKKIVFSGDLGRQHPLILPPPRSISSADYLLIESTYGDRIHDPAPPQESLAKIIRETAARDGHLIIASFAVGRSQDLLYLISKLKLEKSIPDVPVFLDSPMAEDVTELMRLYSKWHSLKADEIRDLFRSVHIVKTVAESKQLLEMKRPSIVISASGMLTGGRVLFHVENRLSDPKNTILLVGFQAAGTRGRSLHDGATEIKMHGHYVSVKAQIKEITTLSAHADQSEIIEWLRHFKTPPQKVFIVHGEPEAFEVLKIKIRDTLGWECLVPQLNEEVPLV